MESQNGWMELAEKIEKWAEEVERWAKMKVAGKDKRKESREKWEKWMRKYLQL